jgi:cytochrome c556
MAMASPAWAQDAHGAGVRQIMLGLTAPASDALFGVSEPEAGSDADLYWETIEADAMMLAEAGRMLQQPGLAVDQGEWMQEAKALVETSLAAAAAVKGRNVDTIFEAGDKVYGTCESCHGKYLEQVQGKKTN